MPYILVPFQQWNIKTPVSFATNLGRAIIDSITIIRGEDEGLFADAKVVEVSGEPEVIEGEVEDTDFLHTDTVTVDGVKNFIIRSRIWSKNHIMHLQ